MSMRVPVGCVPVWNVEQTVARAIISCDPVTVRENAALTGLTA
jgi:hypothetical protein